MARNSYTNAMPEARTARDLMQTHIPRIDTNETQGQSTSARANQMQLAIQDLLTRLTNARANPTNKEVTNSESASDVIIDAVAHAISSVISNRCYLKE